MNDFLIGQHGEAIRRLQSDMTDVASDVKKVLRMLDEKKGERRAVAKVAAISGAAIGSASTLIFKLVMVKVFGVLL